MDWAHVLVIVQCHIDGCSLSCEDGAVAWQSFRQLMAGCLNILEMAVDDCRSPHFLIHFGSISVYFTTWSLCFTILTELCLGFLYRDQKFAYSFNEVVFFGIVIVRSGWEVGCPRGLTNSALISAEVMASYILILTGDAGSSGHASSPIWSRSIWISSGSAKFVQGMMCWLVNAGTSFQIAMHGQL